MELSEIEGNPKYMIYADWDEAGSSGVLNEEEDEEEEGESGQNAVDGPDGSLNDQEEGDDDDGDEKPTIVMYW